jgi:tetratricopeptide (TPR) repeat protein
MLMRGWLAVLVGCACAMAHAVSPVVEEARALMSQGQFAQALERLDRHLASSPQDAEARFTRGLALVRLDRNDDAARAFADLTRDFPQLPEPYNNLAVIHAQQGDYDKAREALEDALAKHPSYAVAHENLGDIHAALAAAAYNRARSLDPSNTALRDKLELVSQLDRLADGGASTTPTAAAPIASPVPAPAAAPDRAEVERVVRAWAAAWSAKDADAYLSFYAPDFAPDGGATRAAWEAQRRERIARPKQIRVEVADLRVAPLPGGGVEVTFRQDYRSDALRNESRKVLEMAQVGGQWRIRREQSR